MAAAAPPAWRPADRFFEISLLGLLASGYCAVAGSRVLDLPTVALAGLSLLARALMILGWLRLRLSERVITAATILYIGFYPIDYAWISGEFLTATVHLVFFLAIIKVLTARTNRDYFFLKVLGFLQLLAASVLSASLSFFFFLGLFLLFTVATFASSEIRRASEKHAVVVRTGLRRFPVRLALLCGFVTAGILVVSAGLFLVLPRTAQAAFRRFSFGHTAVSGFSSRVSLGQLGRIRQESTPVMHVVMPDRQRGAGVKWRGIALGRFDGRNWTNPFQAGREIPAEGRVVRLNELRPRPPLEFAQYDVFLRSTGSDILFFAGTPALISIGAPRVVETALDAYRVIDAADDLHYTVSGQIDSAAVLPPEDILEPLSGELREVFLKLPQIDDRVGELAHEVTAGAANDLARARLVERYLRSHYGYTTRLLDAPVADPLAHFLFVRRQGHCEYFASAMAVMLRTLAIPSRVVTGFQNGVFNPLTGKQVIRMSDAHSWVEAWMPRRGWVSFDPTPPDPEAESAGIAARLALYVDAAETFWQDWVVNYDLEQQLNLASSMRSSRTWSLSWFDPGAWARQASRLVGLLRRWGGVLLALAGAIAAAVFLAPRLLGAWRARVRVRNVKRGAVTASDATLLYQRMLACLHRRGFEKPPWLTPAEFAEVLPSSSRAASLVAAITREYQFLRYAHRTDSGPRMLSLIEQLEALREA